MKKLLSVFVSLVFLSIPFTVAAASVDKPTSNPSFPPVQLSGTIVDERENSIEVYSQISDKTIVLNISENTYIIDAASGGPTELKDRTNDNVSVYYGPMETRSLPPQSNAVAIICNIPQDFAPLHYTLVEEVEKGSDETKVTANEGSLIITIKNDTPISSYVPGKAAEIDDIDIGSELLLWYSMVAMSYPGQATATKAVILERPQAEVAMVPLRTTAEAQGYTLTWDGDTKSVTVSKDEQSYVLTIGENQYGDVQLEAAPELRDSLTYVPSSFFEKVLNKGESK